MLTKAMNAASMLRRASPVRSDHAPSLPASSCIRKRLGRSPGKGDAVVMAWSEGNKAAMARTGLQATSIPIGSRTLGWVRHPSLITHKFVAQESLSCDVGHDWYGMT